MGFTPSHYQETVLDFVLNGRGHGVVNAYAGSGKTATLAWIAGQLKCERILYAAFNTAIVEEAREKFPKNVEVRTINSLGNGAIWVKNRQTKLNPSKYMWLINQLMEQLEDPHIAPFEVPKETWQAILNSDPVGDLKKLCDFTRNTLTNYKNMKDLSDMADHYDLDIDYELLPFYQEALTLILDRGRALVPQEIDYNDQLWIPATDPKIWPKRYDFCLVDECQDLSAAKLAVVRKALKKGARAIFVGDRFQSIYGFSGANTDSVDQIINTMKAKEMPLSICYRCDEAILDEVRNYVPDIEARPDAGEGTVRNVTEDVMRKELHEGDLVLCRTNAPLLKLCFQLISDGISARIKGRDIGKNLLTTALKIKKSSGPEFCWEEFPNFARSWGQAAAEKILAINGGDEEDPKIESIFDKVECLNIIWSRGKIHSLEDMEEVIEDLFSDTRPSVWLSSVHRAKGLQNPRVFIIKPELLPGPWAKPGTWQYVQELNLYYVACTRAESELIYVNTNNNSSLEL